MSKRGINLWRSLIWEPFGWLAMATFMVDFSEAPLPEKMAKSEYITRLLRLVLPFFTVLYALAVISFPFVCVWYGYDIPTPYPFAKLAIWSALCEIVVLFCGSFFPTRFGLLLTIAIGMPAAFGSVLGIALF